MAKSQRWQWIPTKLTPHAVFNNILQLLYMGCQWQATASRKGFHRQAQDSLHANLQCLSQVAGDAIFIGSVLTLKQTGHLEASVLHGDGTTTAAQKGGDNIGLSGHKKMKGDKVVTFCWSQLQRNRTPRVSSRQSQRVPHVSRSPGAAQSLSPKPPAFARGEASSVWTAPTIAESIAKPFSAGGRFPTSTPILAAERLQSADPNQCLIPPFSRSASAWDRQ